jgi:hypothetical protein
MVILFRILNLGIIFLKFIKNGLLLNLVLTGVWKIFFDLSHKPVELFRRHSFCRFIPESEPPIHQVFIAGINAAYEKF